jgi:hypothetical protein
MLLKRTHLLNYQVSRLDNGYHHEHARVLYKHNEIGIISILL